ncbi:hypothetical protein FRC98_00785 [Lujinxingia vulgaris]|uniref:Protein kinase domain-containing protein n=1 Tax=Lujinxingia vulgaris TaxID=2600176 RepID=A0A5C6XNJ4_9DELT|nr:hypothetical protein [Lujinxingia vulgaris]TXD38969.1 hypothetical protein FRC98_00785 [Lujinxingia vulgaris]
MSDDRFKQARRSLIDRANQRQQGGDGGFESDADDKTQMVDLNALQGAPEPQFAPPPTFDGPSDEATQLFELPPDMMGGPGADDHITSSAPDYSGYSQPAAPAQPAQPAAPSMGGSGGHQVYVGDEAPDYEGSTQFVNIADFAEQAAHYTPEQQAAGYDGNTQFVDVNALMAGAEASGGDPIENDQDLQRGYIFTPDAIQRGDITLIFAQNQLGRPVVLKRVWEGPAEQMSTPLRQRIAQLHALRHPNLVPMNGMFVSKSGMWVEIDRPEGTRLTQIIQQQGPQDPEQVIAWLKSVSEVLETIHAQQLAYANLTTDAVWITPQGEAMVEPFDMLRFEDRGGLGAFGPPEMQFPPAQRQLSPATDVFSLAAVATAALTGLPLDSSRLAQLGDQKLAQALQTALHPDPTQRQQTPAEFAAALKSGGGSGGLDIKVVIGGVAALMMLTLVAMMFMGGEPAQPAPQPQQQAAAPAQPGTQEPAADPNAPAAAAPAAAEDPAAQANAPPVPLPGTVVVDQRLTISQSFKQNPPASGPAEITEDQFDELRAEARRLKEEGDKARRSEQLDSYRPALEAVTQVIRAQKEPAEDDLALWREIYDNREIKDYIKDLRERVEGELDKGLVGKARNDYEDLSAVDPSANADDFIQATTSAEVVAVTRNEDDTDK